MSLESKIDKLIAALEVNTAALTQLAEPETDSTADTNTKNEKQGPGAPPPTKPVLEKTAGGAPPPPDEEEAVQENEVEEDLPTPQEIGSQLKDICIAHFDGRRDVVDQVLRESFEGAASLADVPQNKWDSVVAAVKEKALA
jgi:hypothetical protein